MGLIRWVVSISFAVVVIVFAVANRASVEVGFDPLPFTLPVPLYAIVFGAAIIWFSGLRWRSLARHRGNRVDFLERELKRLSRPADRVQGVSSRLPTVAAR